MPIEILTEAMRRVAGEDIVVEQLAEGFGGPTGPAEGPVWIAEGGYLLFSDIHNSRRMRYTPGQGITVDRENTAGGNGISRDPQGRLVVCHHLSRCVDREEPDGSVTLVADRYHGLRLNRPNDLAIKSDGAIYFSDPPPRLPLTPPDHHSELDVAGVYRVSPDLQRVNRVIVDLANPNGLCFSPDEKTLYVVDSNRHRKSVKAYEVEANGMLDLGSERTVADMRADTRKGGPDGIKCDLEGNVYVTAPGGIWVISPNDEHIGTILSDSWTINMAWGDDDLRTLYFVGFNTLNRVRLGIPGVPVPRGDQG